LQLDQVKQACAKIKQQVDPSLKMQILFSGGEPTVWKNFSDLAEHLYNDEWSLNIVTNLSRSISWWANLRVTWHQISASLHPEFVDIEDFIKKLDQVSNQTKFLTVRVMLHPDPTLFQKAIRYGYQIKARCPTVYVEWVPILLEFGTAIIPLSPYSEEQSIMIAKLKPGSRITNQFEYENQKTVVWDNQTEHRLQAQTLISENKVNFQSWTCNAGLDGIFINSQGNIYRGTCLQGDPIGHILDENILLPTSPVVCNKKFCGCVTDVYYSKKK
jgi:MoaA/NifB/PqqE/SkfB family radical SAM enzyme